MPPGDERIALEPSDQELEDAHELACVVRDLVLDDGWDTERVSLLVAQRFASHRAAAAVEFATLLERERGEVERLMNDVHSLEIRYEAVAMELKRIKRQLNSNGSEP